MTKEFNAVGSFIYAGGFTVGMSESFNVLAHLEGGSFGVATVNKNFPQLPVHIVPDEWPLIELRKQGCDVCYANPPCAPWSSAGSRSAVAAERTTDHLTLTRLMKELDPTIWVWESVTGAYLGEHNGLSEYVTEYAMELGYSVYHFLHDVKFMGLAQQRRRVFTVASKVEIDFEPPDHRIITVGQALQIPDPGEIPAGSYKWTKFIPLVEQGERLRKVVLEAQGRPGPGFLIHRANVDTPSRTLLGGVHVIHPTEDRFIGHKEAAALCGYPADYEFDRKGGDFFQQIARAVTPSAGRYLGRVLRLALLKNKRLAPSEWEINFMGTNQRVNNYEMLNIVRRIK